MQHSATEMDTASSLTTTDIPEEQEATIPPTPPPTGTNWFTILSFGAVILLGAILRFVNLGERPLHHDESMHAYFSMQLLQNNIKNWSACLNPALAGNCYSYQPILHGPFQFHAIAIVYLFAQGLGVQDNGITTTTVRIAAALAGTAIVALPYFLRDRLTTLGSWLACCLLAVSPGMVYYSRFAREDIYFACFTLLLVIAAAHYLRTRKTRFLLLASAALALSYATFEGTFLTIAIFGSFMGALLIWELAQRWQMPEQNQRTLLGRYQITTWAPFAIAAYFLVGALCALAFFIILKNLSVYINNPKNTMAANTFVQNLKNTTLVILPCLGILLSLYILFKLVRETQGKSPLGIRQIIARHIDPQRQPLLDAIFSMPWTQWFFALLAGWAIFCILFTALFTNTYGIADGIWQGLYYWLQQQQVARGDQPWYYYFMLIPLYEQIGLVFGIVGLVRCLRRPTRFRLFLIYWFVGSLLIYSWAGEKMPWLEIHIALPMLLLGGIGLEPIVRRALAYIRDWWTYARREQQFDDTLPAKPIWGQNVITTGVTLLCTLFLLVLTCQNMLQLSFLHPADGTQEMMIYVQTTPNVNTVMSKIDTLDQQLYQGKHLLPIGVTSDVLWPYAWYLRDYTNVCYDYPVGCSINAKSIQVIISGGASIARDEMRYGDQYNFQTYEMRSQWDQGYMPPPCIPTKTTTCPKDQSPYFGVGLLTWLSYGNTTKPHPGFNLALAGLHIWQWWWQRRPFGGVDQGTQMVLFIHKGAGVTP